MPSIKLIFHSVSGGSFRIADEIAKGVEEIETCTAQVLWIPEPGGAEPITMPGLRVVSHPFDHVPEATIHDLANCNRRPKLLGRHELRHEALSRFSSPALGPWIAR